MRYIPHDSERQIESFLVWYGGKLFHTFLHFCEGIHFVPVLGNAAGSNAGYGMT